MVDGSRVAGRDEYKPMLTSTNRSQEPKTIQRWPVSDHHTAFSLALY